MVRPESDSAENGRSDRHSAEPRTPLAAELVVAYIRQLVVRGEYRSGDKLPPERELAMQIGVSRPSVRAGIQSLAAVGLVESRRGAGTFVSGGPPRLDINPLSMYAVLHGVPESELFEARRTLEVDLAGLAAERATGEDLAAISEEVMEMFASMGDMQRFLIHDIGFHRAVAAAARNPLLGAMMEMVADLFYDQRKNTVHRWKGAELAAAHHRQIYQAIRAGDVERARSEMGAHLRWAQEVQELELKSSRDDGGSGS